jgi:hypothetical protein
MPMRRVAIASFAGTTIEFYDLCVYGTAATRRSVSRSSSGPGVSAATCGPG